MSAWLTQQGAAFALALRRLGGNPTTTLLAALTIAIALALPTGGQLLLSSLQALGQGSSATPQLSVYMALEADKKTVADVESRIRANANVREVKSVSKEETQKRMRAAEGLAQIIDSLPKNPFPDAFIVTPKDEQPDAMATLRDELNKLPRVEHVQLDSAWAKRLSVWLQLARTTVWLLAALFGVGLLALIFNTIRLQVLTQREEIEVSRLLGATDSYIGRPFYYFGALQSLLGGALAIVIVFVATRILQAPIAELVSLYSLDFSLHNLRLVDIAALLTLAAGLGWLGAALSVRRHLRRN